MRGPVAVVWSLHEYRVCWTMWSLSFACGRVVATPKDVWRTKNSLNRRNWQGESSLLSGEPRWWCWWQTMSNRTFISTCSVDGFGEDRRVGKQPLLSVCSNKQTRRSKRKLVKVKHVSTNNEKKIECLFEVWSMVLFSPRSRTVHPRGCSLPGNGNHRRAVANCIYRVIYLIWRTKI